MPTAHDGTEDEERALNTFIRFTRAFDTVDQEINRIFQAHDLTSGQFGVLETLYHLGPLHQGALGDKLLQSKGNISTIISNLEKRDLVERLDVSKRLRDAFDAEATHVTGGGVGRWVRCVGVCL